MASYSITGNQFQCFNASPNAAEVCNSTAFAGFRAWGTVSTADSAESVTLTCVPYFTYGRDSYAPTGSVTGMYVVTVDNTIKLSAALTKTVSSPYQRYDLHQVTATIAKGHASKTCTVYFRFERSSHTMKRFRSLASNNSYPVSWGNNTTSPASSDTGSSGRSIGHATITIPAKASYTISYSANGGSSTPASQTKWYGENITLQPAISRTGYTFAGWKWSGDGKVYAAGSSWNVANASGTMTAQWTANTYKVSYNNNGGTGTIAEQSKAYNASVTLANNSNKAMKKTDKVNGAVREYLIKSTGGWNTNAGGTGTSYNLGGTIAANTITSNITLYAQWQAKYIYPTITNFSVIRNDTVYSTDESDDGEYLYIKFNWTGYSENANASSPTFTTPTCKITVDGSTQTVPLNTQSATYTYRPVKASTDTTAHEEKMYYSRGDSEPASGTYTYVYPYYYTAIPVEDRPIGANPASLDWYEFPTYSQDTTHNVTVELYDPNYTTSKVVATLTVATAILPIDLYGDGENVYMGIMHPYVVGQAVTTSDLYADNLYVDEDTDLYNAIVALGWQNDVIV